MWRYYVKLMKAMVGFQEILKLTLNLSLAVIIQILIKKDRFESLKAMLKLMVSFNFHEWSLEVGEDIAGCVKLRHVEPS